MECSDVLMHLNKLNIDQVYNIHTILKNIYTILHTKIDNLSCDTELFNVQSIIY